MGNGHSNLSPHIVNKPRLNTFHMKVFILNVKSTFHNQVHLLVQDSSKSTIHQYLFKLVGSSPCLLRDLYAFLLVRFLACLGERASFQLQSQKSWSNLNEIPWVEQISKNTTNIACCSCGNGFYGIHC